MLLSSHALTELEGRADRVVIVNRGVKIADGTIESLRRIARLPTRIRVKLADDRAGGLFRTGGWRRVNGHQAEIDAGPGEKIELLRSIASPEVPVEDIEVVPPSLDDLYAHFLGSRESAG